MTGPGRGGKYLIDCLFNNPNHKTVTLPKEIKTLSAESKLLYWTGIIQALFAVLFLILSCFDDRQLLGINVWLKPFKFSISFAIFAWTFGWVWSDLRRHTKLPKIPYLFQNAPFILVVGFILEFGIYFQAARGVKSHHNLSSFWDAVIYLQLMAVGTYLILFSLCLLFAWLWKDQSLSYSKIKKLGYLVGTGLTIISCVQGYSMVFLQSHSLGGPDGSLGLPLLNFSRVYGDLRVSHMLALHAFQVMPITAWLFERYNLSIRLMWAWVGLYSFAFLYLLIQAALKIPVWP